MEGFTISQNKYLSREVRGYYHCKYKGYQKEGNPDFINHLKNSSKKSEMDLVKDFIMAYEVLNSDLKEVAKRNKEACYSVCCVPRSKKESVYKNSQLLFRKIVSCVADDLDLVDSTTAIIRTKDTQTTHNWRLEKNTGDAPYVGITKNTCSFEEKLIKNKEIILIDDVYTPGVNVVEDCIQSLFDFGAKSVILYVIAKVV